MKIILFITFMGNLEPWPVTYSTYKECHQVEHMLLRINEHNNHGTPKKKAQNLYYNGVTGATIIFISCE